ncbi:MAG: hypothetical protein N2749_01750 [Clostridia bacterium]|nr:hypothetical protein [Clostridia bacterium]
MSISKISRSIVVVIFIALILLLNGLDILTMINNTSVTKSEFRFDRIVYPILVLILVSIYVYIKNKLYKQKIDKSISMIYRYIYIVVTVITCKILILRNLLTSFTKIELLAILIIYIATSITIKKIVFNVSKSDILSILAVTLYALITNNIYDTNMYIGSGLVIMFCCLTLLFLQKLIDELKQQGLKTRKYIRLAVVCGIFMGISVIFGVSLYVYLTLLIILFAITYNLDKTHINFSRKLIQKVNITKRDVLYKIERINIEKLFIAVVLIIITLVLTLLVGYVSIKYIPSETLSSILNNSLEYINLDFDLTNMMSKLQLFVSTSKIYYLIIFSYIILIEILNIILRRKYDTKSTIVKLLFILSVGMYCSTNLNIQVYQGIFTVLLILIVIVNTSNIYLNREERIKLLKA